MFSATELLRAAYAELDDTGYISRATLRNLDTAGIETRVFAAFQDPETETN
jgi:hypothetical protein